MTRDNSRTENKPTTITSCSLVVDKEITFSFIKLQIVYWLKFVDFINIPMYDHGNIYSRIDLQICANDDVTAFIVDNLIGY